MIPAALNAFADRLPPAAGECSATCLLAHPDSQCSCRCGGAYHGTGAQDLAEAVPTRRRGPAIHIGDREST